MSAMILCPNSYSFFNLDHLEWINKELDGIKSCLPAGIEVNIRVYVTGKLDPRAEMDVPTLESGEMAEVSASAVTSASASNEKLELDSPKTERSSKATINGNFLMNVAHLRPSVAQLLEDEVSACDDSVAICGETLIFCKIETMNLIYLG